VGKKGDRVKFAMCNETCTSWDLASVCRLASDVGYDGIEVAPFTLAESVEEIDEDERRRIRETVSGHGLEVVGLHWLLASPDGLHLNSPDPAVRTATVEYLGAEIDFCADIGGRTLVLGSPKQRGVLEGQTYEAVWDRMVSVCRELAAHAEARDVCLCIEPLGFSETNFICTAAEARRLVEEVGFPAFRMILDVKAMAEEAEPIPDIIRNSAAYLAHFHANDANRQGPGFGDTDFWPIAAALRGIAYEAYVSVEVFDYSAGPEKIARESLRYLQQAFAAG
jgi:sugar phosphate isomerase/epimerase